MWQETQVWRHKYESVNERMNEWMNIRPVDMPETPHLYPWVPP